MENTNFNRDIIVEHIAVSGVLYVTIDKDIICTHKFSEHIKIKIVFDDSVEERKVKEQEQRSKGAVLLDVQDTVISTVDGDLSAEEHSSSDNSLNFIVKADKSRNNEKTLPVKSMTLGNNNRKKIQDQQTIKSTKTEPTSFSSTSKMITSSRNMRKEIFTAKRSQLYKRMKEDLSESQKTNNNVHKCGTGRKKYSKKLEKEKDVYCPYCCKWFKSQQEFFDHRKAEKQNYSCGKCHKILHYKAHLMVHNIRKHTKLELQDAESVDSGGESFKSSDHSSSNATHETVQKCIKCEICGMVMSNLSSLKTHTMRHTGESAYRCCVCGEQMHSISRYSKHMSSHSNIGRVKCKICNVTFENRSELSRHQLTHTFPCSLCGQAFPNKTGRYFHYKTFHKNDILKCPKCSKLFSSKKELDSHLKYHRNRNKTQCTVCGLFVFRLSMHMLSHASKSEDVNIYVCDKCPKQFKQKLSLQRHLRTHSEEKPYACTECSKQFARSGGLRRHMMTHMPEKPFVCEVCGKACSQLGNLKIHMQTHKESKVLHCTHCGTGFTQKNALQEHMNTVHLLERNIFNPSEQYFQPNPMYNMYY